MEESRIMNQANLKVSNARPHITTLKPLAYIIAAICYAPIMTYAADDTTFTFDEVVVSATRSEQKLKDVSSSVGTSNAQKIDAQMATDLKDVLSTEPGVSMEGQGRFGLSSFNIRGQDGNHVKVIIDGIQQTSIYNTGMGDDDVMRKGQNTIEIDTLQTVEVNKGPSSSLYGSDALGGAVIMRTKNPSDLLDDAEETSFSSVKTGYASVDDSFKSTATMAGRSGKWESLFMYTYKTGHETQTHSSGADIQGPDRGQANPFDIESDNFLAKVFYQVNDAHKIGLTLENYSSTSDGDILSKEGYATLPGYTYSQNTASDADNRQRISIEHKWSANNAAFDTLDWNLSYQQSASEHDNFDHTAAKGYRNRQRNGDEQSTQLNSQFDKAFELANSYHEVIYGLSYLNNSFKLDYTDYLYESATVTPANPEVPSASSDTWGLFIQDQGFYFDEKLVINMGLRYDSYTTDPDASATTSFEKNTNDALTGRLGGVYHFTDQLSTFANISQGFKSPSLDQLYYSRLNTGRGYSIISNPDLKPEESLGYEIGSRFANDHGRIELAAYYNDYKNFIERVELAPDANGIVYTNENIAQARIYGAELKSLLSFDSLLTSTPGFYGSFNLAYSQGEDKATGKSIDSIAPLTTNVALGYDAQDNTFGGELSTQWMAEKSGSDWKDNNNVDAPSAIVTDITVYVRPTTDLTLRAGIFNVTDEKYWLYSNLKDKKASDQGLERRTEPGRNWGINAEYIF
ncbi:MAG: hemoglobin/transferrin/lactoferrin receptor protein [Moritella dasanensis]|jgi:hemoglobin/transferrin/lactoferrin receptor protein